MTFGKMGARGGFGSAGLLGRSGSHPIVPTIVSAANRSRVPQQSANQFFGVQIAGNSYNYTQYRETPVRAVNGIRPIYANIGVNSLTTLRSDIDNAAQEQGCGASITIRFCVVTNIQGTTGDQTGATITTGLFSDAANDRSFTVGTQTVAGCIWKLDNSVANAPTFTQKTYAQFVSDGGSISSSTVDGSSLANTQAIVPRGYVLIADAGPNVSALTPYYLRLEDNTPIMTVTSIDASVANVIVVTVNATGLIKVGDVGTIASATGNTSVNGTWPVTAVNSGANTITFSSPTSTTGAVTGTPTLRWTKPTGVINAAVTTNAQGDYQRASSTQRDVMGSNGKNWITGVGSNLATDGNIISGFCAVIGTDPTGGECVGTDGDSIASEVRDGSTNGPAAVLSGDSFGNTAWLNRALFANGISSIRTAVPGMAAQRSYTKNDDKFRLWLLQFCDRTVTSMGHNDATADGSYSASPGFIQHLSTRWDRMRTAMRGKKFVIATTLTPLTAELLSDHWTTARSATYQQQGGTGGTSTQFIYPTGYVYANYHVNLANGTLVTGAAGGVDGYIDLALFASNLDGSSGAIDGYWPVDGATNYRYCTDGTHPSRDGHAGIASQVTTTVLRTAKVIT